MQEYTTSRPRPLLLFLVQSEEGYISNLDHLESDTRNISDGMTLSTKSGNEYFVVFFNVVETTISGYESRNLLSILDELNPDTLSNGRVGLLGFYSNLFQDDSLGMRSTSERIGLPSGSKVSLLVVLIVPSLFSSMILELPCNTKSLRFSHFLVDFSHN